jgi:hypothetical protein
MAVSSLRRRGAQRSANTVLQSSDRCINVNVGFEVGRVEVVMKFPMAALIALTLVGCSPATPSPPSPDPTTPTLDSPSPSPSPPGPPAATNGWIWAMAVDRTGRCIADATFEIMSGQGPIGDIIRQETPCSVWDYSGGIMLRNLTTGVAMTLRASWARIQHSGKEPLSEISWHCRGVRAGPPVVTADRLGSGRAKFPGKIDERRKGANPVGDANPSCPFARKQSAQMSVAAQLPPSWF